MGKTIHNSRSQHKFEGNATFEVDYGGYLRWIGAGPLTAAGTNKENKSHSGFSKTYIRKRVVAGSSEKLGRDSPPNEKSEEKRQKVEGKSKIAPK
jgi:hypothetical protein